MNAPTNIRLPAFEAMEALVEQAATTRRPLAVDTAVTTILAQYPDTGLTADEMRDHMSRLAVGRQVTVAFGC